MQKRTMLKLVENKPPMVLCDSLHTRELSGAGSLLHKLYTDALICAADWFCPM
jgi:hypothetical protein